VDQAWQDRSAELLSISRWRAQGKVALKNAEQAESANLDWRQQNDISHLKLSGPIGLGATTVYADGSRLEVTQNGETRRYDVSTPEKALAQTGWDLPVKALQYWLKGVPYPGLDQQGMELDRGLLMRLEQAGWTLSYENYGQFGQYFLPTRLTIERDTTRARLLIRHWTIGAGG